MSAQITHPFGEDNSRTERLIERINRFSRRVGLLGFIGLLENLSFAFDFLSVTQLFYPFFLLFFIPLIIGIVQYVGGHARSWLSDDKAVGRNETEEKPTDWVESGYEQGILKRLQMLWLLVHPNIALRGFVQTFGNLVIMIRHRGNVPDARTYESDVDYRLPFDGEWTVLNGSPDPWYSHSWSLLQQRYAHDFVITDDEGRTHDGSGGPEAFYCFDEPLLAPADGTVVAAKGGHRDYHRTTGWFDPLQWRLRGNYVIIKHADDEYSCLAHLKEGSICVSEGDTVERGEQIGRCGHSGNSTEPHLHFHVQDSPNFYFGMGLPVEFSSTTSDHPDGEPTHYDRTYVHSGQIVSYDPEA